MTTMKIRGVSLYVERVLGGYGVTSELPETAARELDEAVARFNGAEACAHCGQPAGCANGVTRAIASSMAAAEPGDRR